MSITETQTTTAYQQEFVARIIGANQQTLDTLKKAFSMFGALNEFEAPIVVRKLRGERNCEIATATGVSKQVVFARWKFVKAKIPAFSALKNGSEGTRRGGGRKPGCPGGRKKKTREDEQE